MKLVDYLESITIGSKTLGSKSPIIVKDKSVPPEKDFVPIKSKIITKSDKIKNLFIGTMDLQPQDKEFEIKISNPNDSSDSKTNFLMKIPKNYTMSDLSALLKKQKNMTISIDSKDPNKDFYSAGKIYRDSIQKDEPIKGIIKDIESNKVLNLTIISPKESEKYDAIIDINNAILEKYNKKIENPKYTFENLNSEMTIPELSKKINKQYNSEMTIDTLSEMYQSNYTLKDIYEEYFIEFKITFSNYVPGSEDPNEKPRIPFVIQMIDKKENLNKYPSDFNIVLKT